MHSGVKMKKHIMNLNPSPFDKIKSGIKTIELRLYDEKRQGIEVGDSITFVNTANSDDILQVKVVALHLFESFDELYKNLPLLKCGYTEEDLLAASPVDMDAYYPKKKQRLYDVVGIEIELL